MKVPQQVPVKGTIYEIQYKWNLNDEGVPCLGLCDPEEKIIYIDKSLSKEDKWKTFLHELKHALIEEYNLAKSEGIDALAEELICYMFSEWVSEMWDVRWKKGVLNV